MLSTAVDSSTSWYTMIIKEQTRPYGEEALRRLKPRNDFIFQRLFGEQETKDSLISLLNAILGLEGARQITDLTVIENKQLSKMLIDDKTGRLDVRAETKDHVQINIEVQLSNQRNMAKRSLFYAAKMYTESIKAGGKYEDLKKTIAINILDYNAFGHQRYHSTFHLYEDHITDFMMTDALEIHFIEYPKFRAIEKNYHNSLHRWLLYLDDKMSNDQLKELMEMDPVIRKTEARLEWLSGDEETLRLYEAREHARIEFNSNMSEARAEGKAEGEAAGKLLKAKEIAANMLSKGIEVSLIIEITGLSSAEIETLQSRILHNNETPPRQ